MGAPYPEAIRDWVLRTPPAAKDVFYLSDLPPAVGGIITLESGVIYRIRGTLNIGTNRIVGTDIFLSGEGSFANAIIGATSDALVTASGGIYAVAAGMFIYNLGTGPAIDFSASLGSASVTIQNSVIQSDGGLAARIEDAMSLFFIHSTFFGQQGVKLDGVIDEASFLGTQFAPVAGATAWKGLEITSAVTLNGLSATGCVFNLPNATDIGLSFSPSATYTRPITLVADAFGLAGTPIDPAGIQKSNKNLIVLECVGQESSLFTGRASFQGNVAVSTFPDADFYPIGNGTPAHTLFSLNPLSERTVLTGAQTQLQTLDCDAAEEHSYLVQASLALFKAGVAADMTFAIQVNGVNVPASVRSAEVAATGRTLTISCMVSLAPGDAVRVVMSNPSLANVTVTSADLLIHRL